MFQIDTRASLLQGLHCRRVKSTGFHNNDRGAIIGFIGEHGVSIDHDFQHRITTDSGHHDQDRRAVSGLLVDIGALIQLREHLFEVPSVSGHKEILVILVILGMDRSGQQSQVDRSGKPRARAPECASHRSIVFLGLTVAEPKSATNESSFMQ
jgi:hypothetical protein